MIRAGLVIVVFLGVTLSLILMQPRSAPHITEQEREDAEAIVTRAQTEYNALTMLDETPVVAAADPVYDDQAAQPLVAPQPEPQPAPAALQTEPVSTSSLEQLIIEAIQQGQSEQYILALIQQAKAEGDNTQETSHTNAHTNTFLSLLDRDTSTPSPTRASQSHYVVQPGDSLASISQQFYGDTLGAFDIFTANRGILDAPDNVVVGQELVIPIR
ncbi:MAG: LysM peptidoglycan-binding domain-containing protein [Roseovarius sp.]